MIELYAQGKFIIQKGHQFKQSRGAHFRHRAQTFGGKLTGENLRLGHYLGDQGTRYWQAGLTVMQTLLSEPYLSLAPDHQGLILHSVYHRPNGWDHIPSGRKVPCDESSMWGDYHAREAALYLTRQIDGNPYLTFFGPRL